MIEYTAVLTTGIGLVFAICGTEIVRIKAGFAMARINVCFNVSFLNFNQYVK